MIINEPTDEERQAFKATTIHCQDEAQLAIVTAYLDRVFAPPKTIMETVDELIVLRDALQRLTEGGAIASPIPEKHGEYDGMWISGSSLEEEFSLGDPYDTRESAIADAAEYHGLAAGEFFQTAKVTYTRYAPGCPFDADDAIERAGERASDEWWEGAIENFESAAFKHKGDLEAKLEKTWDEWCEAHGIVLEGYTTSELQSHQVGVDDAELEPVPA